MALTKSDKEWFEQRIDVKLAPINTLLEKYGTSLYGVDGKTDRIGNLETEQHKAIGRKSVFAGLIGAGGGVGIWQFIKFFFGSHPG